MCSRHWSGGLFAFTVVAVFAAAAGTVRYAGCLQSINPGDATLVIEDMGPRGRIDLLEISYRNADIVRVSRNLERRTDIYRWPIGTFLVITGKRNSLGAIEAHRVEIPKVPPD
jgi:hypothetical protein